MIKKIKTFDEIRGEMFGATDLEEEHIRRQVLEDTTIKVNEIIDWISEKSK